MCLDAPPERLQAHNLRRCQLRKHLLATSLEQLVGHNWAQRLAQCSSMTVLSR